MMEIFFSSEGFSEEKEEDEKEERERVGVGRQAGSGEPRSRQLQGRARPRGRRSGGNLEVRLGSEKGNKAVMSCYLMAVIILVTFMAVFAVKAQYSH